MEQKLLNLPYEMDCDLCIDEKSVELWIDGPCSKESNHVIETLARWSKDRKVDGREAMGYDEDEICPLDIFWTAHIVSGDMKGMISLLGKFEGMASKNGDKPVMKVIAAIKSRIDQMKEEVWKWI